MALLAKLFLESVCYYPISIYINSPDIIAENETTNRRMKNSFKYYILHMLGLLLVIGKVKKGIKFFLTLLSNLCPCYHSHLYLLYFHTRLHLGFSAKLRIWQVSACKMEPQSGTIITLELASQPTSSVPTLIISMLCGVPTPIVPSLNEVCAVSPLPVYVFSHPNCSPI